MWELDHKESWTPQNWCFWTVVLEKTFESPLDSREIKSLNPKGNQPRTFVGRTDAETEYSLEGLMLKLKLQYFGHLMKRVNSLEKTLMLGKIEGRRRRGLTKEGMVGWHHWLKGHESEQTPGDSEGQGTWRAAVHGITKCWTRLNDWITTITLNSS